MNKTHKAETEEETIERVAAKMQANTPLSIASDKAKAVTGERTAARVQYLIKEAMVAIDAAQTILQQGTTVLAEWSSKQWQKARAQ